MIDWIRQQMKRGVSSNDRLNIVRESLQILCLKTINDKGYFNHLAFLGGTSLRILFSLRRFSEDLDFSIYEKTGYELTALVEELRRAFHFYNIPLETKEKSEGNVQNVMMKFTGLLKELGLSALAEQKLSIKLEMDMNPPAGWNLENTLITKTYLFNITHYDLPSLYAGKLHACFFRKFTKGRDFYDFAWYLGGKIKPNFLLLNNAILQTEKKHKKITKKNFKDFLLQSIQKIDFNAVKKDVERFLEDKTELGIFNAKTIRSTIERTCS